MPKTLAEIATHTDKNGAHAYVKWFYEEALQAYRDQPISLLEVGIWFGGSLRAWHEYFPKAEVFIGIDKSPDPCPQGGQHKHLAQYLSKLPYKVENIKLLYGDAYSAQMIEQLGDRRFDIIIDDGSHTLDAQKAFLARYLPLLKPGGLAVIEDVADQNFIPQFKAMLPSGYHGYHVDLRKHHNKLPDDQLYVVYRQIPNQPKLHNFGQFSIAPPSVTPPEAQPVVMQTKPIADLLNDAEGLLPVRRINPIGLSSPQPKKHFLVEQYVDVQIFGEGKLVKGWVDVAAQFTADPAWPKEDSLTVLSAATAVATIAKAKNLPGVYRLVDAITMRVTVLSRPVLEVEID